MGATKLRANTIVTICMGPLVDKADGVTEKTALTPTVRVRKFGGSFGARSSATAVAHDEKGYYNVELSATDVNTLGALRAAISDTANVLPVWRDFDVVSEDAYDAEHGALLALQDADASRARLDAGASAVTSFYVGQGIHIAGGTGAGQTRCIIAYDGATKWATLDRPWITNPVVGSTFRIVASGAVSGIETGLSLRDAMRIAAATCGGKRSGEVGGSSTVLVKSAVSGTKTRMTITTDAFGNITNVAYDFSE